LKQLSDLSFSSRFRFFTKSESSIMKSRVEQLESAAMAAANTIARIGLTRAAMFNLKIIRRIKNAT